MLVPADRLSQWLILADWVAQLLVDQRLVATDPAARLHPALSPFFICRSDLI